MVEDKNAECEAPPPETNKIELHMYPLNPDGSWRDGEAPPKPRPKPVPKPRPIPIPMSLKIQLNGGEEAALARLQAIQAVKSLGLSVDPTRTTAGLKRMALAELIARQFDR